MKNNKGFTLIELLVVVLIIGILAAIALPQYFKAVRKSRATEALIAVKSLKDSADRYALAYGTLSGIASEKLDIEMPTSNNFKYTVGSTQILAEPSGTANIGGIELCYTYTAADTHISATRPNCENGTNSAGVCESLGASVTVGTCE